VVVLAASAVVAGAWALAKRRQPSNDRLSPQPGKKREPTKVSQH